MFFAADAILQFALMNLPDLRILPLELLVPHERTDPRRVDPLIERLHHEAVLRNPPIVAPIDERFVVLDGANRTTAFQRLRMPHILAQVVNYDQVRLEVWHHVLTRCDANELLEKIVGIRGLRLNESDHVSARASLARRESLAFVSIENNTICLSGGDNLIERTRLLNELTDAYEGCAHVQRTTSDHLEDARKSFADAVAVVVFPCYDRAEIIDLARTGVRVPAGITRHVLPLRALRLNYPMQALQNDIPLDEKQNQLSAWIHEKIQTRQARTYTEPTILFDE